MDLNRGITLTQCLSHIFETANYSDITFKVGPTLEEIKAHRFILMGRSPFFATMFTDRWDPSKMEVIQIPDVQPKSFKLFLKYLYTDELYEEDEDDVIPINELIDVLSIAHMYCVQGLVEDSSGCIHDKIGIKTCVEIFQRTLVYYDVPVGKIAFDFFMKNISQIITDDSFHKLNVQSMKQLLENDDLEMDEVSLFKGLLKWSQDESPVLDENMIPVPRTSVMPMLVRLIRYPLMKGQSFAQEIVPTKVLTEEEVNEMLLYFTESGPIPKNMITKSRTVVSEATIRFKVENVYELEREFSPPIMIRNLPWKIMVMTSNIHERDQEFDPQWKGFGFFLECNGDSDSWNWSCYAEASLTILKQKSEDEPEQTSEAEDSFTRTITHIFKPEELDWGYRNFLDWKSLIDRNTEYVKDNTIILEAKVKANVPKLFNSLDEM